MKQNIFASVAFLLAVLLSCNGQTPSPAAPQNKDKSPAMTCTQLEGKQYSITLTTNGKDENPEILSFKNNLVESSACGQYCFMASPYTCNPATDGSLAIGTVMTSEKEGRMDWQIRATEGKVSGSVLWVKAGQADIAYTFEGMIK